MVTFDLQMLRAESSAHAHCNHTRCGYVHSNEWRIKRAHQYTVEREKILQVKRVIFGDLEVERSVKLQLDCETWRK